MRSPPKSLVSCRHHRHRSGRRPALAGLLLVLLFAASSIDAKRIYSYRDDQGVMHYSDSAPVDATGEVSEQLIAVDPKKLVFLREEGPDADRRYSLWNGYAGPLEVLMEFQDSANVVSEPPLPGVRVIPAQQQSLILQVQPIDDRIPWSYRWSYRYVYGDPNATPDLNAEYQLPFSPSLRLRVDQGFGGTYSHTEPHSYHAVDISMDEGTPIRAARAGVVMSVESDFYGAGTDIAKFGDRANHIRILHSDGTMAVYAHLALESVIVGIGDRVHTGEIIAKSGNTGFSSGPHLHFVIQRNKGGTLVSVPFEFTVNGKHAAPRQGQILGGAPE
jgi:murein DD-endopeptidase MepM/ murein hydrolase activator NlpD